MSEKQCPECGLWNFEHATRCYCGYDFEQAEAELEAIQEEEESSEYSLTLLNFLSILLAFTILFISVFLPYYDNPSNVTAYIKGHALNDPTIWESLIAIEFKDLNWFARILWASLVILPALGFLTLVAKPLRHLFSLLKIVTCGAMLVCMVWPIVQFKRDTLPIGETLSLGDIFTLNISDVTNLGVGFILIFLSGLILIGINGISLFQGIYSRSLEFDEMSGAGQVEE